MCGPMSFANKGTLNVKDAADDKAPSNPFTLIFGANAPTDFYELARMIFDAAIIEKPTPEFVYEDLNFKEWPELFYEITNYWGITAKKIDSLSKFREKPGEQHNIESVNPVQNPTT